MSFKYDDFQVSNLSPEVLDRIAALIPAGSRILEFGSGLGTRELCKRFDVVSIEHDLEFINQFHENYIHTPLVDRYYELTGCRAAFNMGPFQAVLIDGPPAYRHDNRKARLGFQKLVSLVDEKTILVFDDIDRFWDCANFLLTFLRLRGGVMLVGGGQRRAGVLLRGPTRLQSFSRCLYALGWTIAYGTTYGT